MTLLEAIKSGKPFKRPNRFGFMRFNKYWGDLQDCRSGSQQCLAGIDIIMDDWELYEGDCVHAVKPPPFLFEAMIPEDYNHKKGICKYCDKPIEYIDIEEKWVAC